VPVQHTSCVVPKLSPPPASADLVTSKWVTSDPYHGLHSCQFSTSCTLPFSTYCRVRYGRDRWGGA